MVNKIGTLEKALCAQEFGVPFYVAAPSSTFDLECASGADVADEEDAAADSSSLEAIDDDPPARDTQAAGAGAP